MDFFLTALRVALIFLVIFIERKKPGEALLWCAIIVISPIVGGILYLIFGSTIGIKLTYRLRNRKIQQTYLTTLDEQVAKLEKEELPLDGFTDKEKQLIHFNLHYAEGGIGFYNKAEILSSGQEKYERLFADIAAAKKHIHLAYYSIHKDHVGKKLVEELTKKAKEGVDVKVLCDGVGSLGVRSALFRPLLKAGGEMRTIKPVLTHFRYHRKIAIFDGNIGYVGGMNIGGKYLGENPKKSPWRDTQVRIMGESVVSLQYYFLYDWLVAHYRNDISDRPDMVDELFLPDRVTEELPCQIFGSGVETESQAIKLSYVRMVSLAQNKIVIQTPYFIPSLPLLDSLKVALSSGVDVVLHLPDQRSNFFLDPVTRFYVAQLVPLGVQVLFYEGYLHSKTVRVDERITCIGSVNIDIRSLEVDDELCAVFYSEKFAQDYDEILAVDFERSHEMDYEAFLDRGLWKRASERFFLLFSPLM